VIVGTGGASDAARAPGNRRTGAVATVQSERNGTGHAVSCALDILPADLAGTVLVSYGAMPLLDTAILAGLLEAHRGSADGGQRVVTGVGHVATCRRRPLPHRTATHRLARPR